MSKLIVGLGNLGREYEKSRHNAGFTLIDELALNWGLLWEFNKKLNAEIASATPRDDKVILVKPQTFMNNSGEAVARALAYFSNEPSDLLVIHDDVDLEPLQFKVSRNSSSAGHHGVQNIIDRIGTQDFTRLRVGIGRPQFMIDGTTRAAFDVEKYVLQDFTAPQLEVLKKQGIEHLLSSLTL